MSSGEIVNESVTKSRFNVNAMYAMLLFFGGVSGLIAAGVVVFFNDRSEFDLYFLLPLSFVVFLIMTLCCCHEIYKKYSYLLFLGLYYLKLVVTPAFSAISGWETLASPEVYQEYLTEAILLSVWEPIFVGGGLIIYSRRMRINQIRVGVVECSKDDGAGMDGADVLIWLGVLFILTTLVYYPSLRVRYAWLLNIGSNYDVTPVVRSWRDFFSTNSREVPLGIIDTFMMWLFYFVRVLFPVMLIEKIYKRRWSNRKKILCSLIVIGVGIQITTNANRETILTGLSLILMLFQLFPRFAKKYGSTIIIFGVIAGTTMLILKSTGTGSLGEGKPIHIVSKILNAYLNGPINVSVAIKAKVDFSVSMMIEEILAGVPFLNRFFKGYLTSTLFNRVFWGIEGRTDQLLPSLGQGYMYFGAVFAPVFQLLFVVCGVKLEEIARKSENIKEKGYLMFLAVVIVVTVGNNLSHVLGFILRYLPGVIILWFQKNRVKIR